MKKRVYGFAGFGPNHDGRINNAAEVENFLDGIGEGSTLQQELDKSVEGVSSLVGDKILVDMKTDDRGNMIGVYHTRED